MVLWWFFSVRENDDELGRAAGAARTADEKNVIMYRVQWWLYLNSSVNRIEECVRFIERLNII